MHQINLRTSCLLLVLFTVSLGWASAASFNRKGGSILAGKARFQFLTPDLVRMEYDPAGTFTNAPTAVVQNRKWDPVTVTTAEEVDGRDHWLVAGTTAFRLRYKLGSGPFTHSNLRLEWSDGAGVHAWAPGDTDRNNLGGLASSLDGARKGKLPEFHPGILSRSGYFILDDSKSPVWNAKKKWIEPRAGNEQDLYCFIYGSDYRRALREYAALCGPIPMIPRYTLGAWITDLNYEYLPSSDYVRNYSYTVDSVKSLVTRFRQENIPLDVLVLDFAWHNYGWKGGYDWSRIFPKPEEFLQWSHEQGVKVSVNDHPGYGGESVLSDSDSHAAAIRKALKMPVPPEPKLYIPITGPWKFHTDPDTSQWQHNWASIQLKDSAWSTLEGGKLWEDQGYKDYDGMAWYRKWVDIPAEIPHPFYLIFGGVDDEYDLFINGQRIVHHGAYPYGSVYSTTTWTDISNWVKPGVPNLITVRVNDWGGGGGLGQDPIALSDQEPFKGIHFNLAEKQQAEQFMNILHNPVIDQGVDFWWIDGGSGSCSMQGLNSQMWTNKVYYDYTAQHTGLRSFVFSRYGGWGSHRYPSLFTGDTYSDWAVLNFEVPFTAQGGNVLMPYITHDIGGFQNDTIPFDLYARWLEFGALSPFLRLHSAHENPREGNVRMPWFYGQQGIDLARKYFNLRYSLIPYLYSYCRVATDSSLPLCRPLYLEKPTVESSYKYPGEYYLGGELLVAPVTDTAQEKEIYLPYGEWFNYFTGKEYSGGQVIRERFGLDETPLFVRGGAVIPTQPVRSYSDQGGADTMFVDCYGNAEGSFTMYEDDGRSLEYQKGKFSKTDLTYAPHEEGRRVVIGAANGTYAGQPLSRAWQVRLHGVAKPQSVMIDGMAVNASLWSWDASRNILTIPVTSRNIRNTTRVTVR